MIKKIVIILILTFWSIPIYCQNSWGFTIDTQSIINNKNLRPFIKELKKGNLNEYSSVSFFPKEIKLQLDCLTDSFYIFDSYIENRNVNLNRENATKRELLYLAFNDSVLVMTYIRGICYRQKQILFIKYRNDKIVDLWLGEGNHTSKLNSREEILRYIKKNINDEYSLHGFGYLQL